VAAGDEAHEKAADQPALAEHHGFDALARQTQPAAQPLDFLRVVAGGYAHRARHGFNPWV
jgi:hypothetical protein